MLEECGKLIHVTLEVNPGLVPPRNFPDDNPLSARARSRYSCGASGSLPRGIGMIAPGDQAPAARAGIQDQGNVSRQRCQVKETKMAENEPTMGAAPEQPVRQRVRARRKKRVVRRAKRKVARKVRAAARRMRASTSMLPGRRRRSARRAKRAKRRVKRKVARVVRRAKRKVVRRRRRAARKK
jgi:hypothetical protein